MSDLDDRWTIHGWVLPNDDMLPYLTNTSHIYRILVPTHPATHPNEQLDGASIHHLPLGTACRRGILVSRPASELPTRGPNVRDRACTDDWRDQRLERAPVSDQWCKTEFDERMIRLAKEATLRVHVRYEGRLVPATLVMWRSRRVRVRFDHGTAATVRPDRVVLPDDLTAERDAQP